MPKESPKPPHPAKPKTSWGILCLRIISIAVFISLVAFVLGGLLLPANLAVKSQRRLEWPVEKVHAELSDLRNWPTMLPWHSEDPGMAISYQGTPNGVGMVMSWDSQRHGEGRVTISSIQPEEKIRTAVQFNRQGDCVAEIKLDPVGANGTEVTLSFLSEYGQNYAGRYIGWMVKKYAEEKLAEVLAGLDAQLKAKEERQSLLEARKQGKPL